MSFCLSKEKILDIPMDWISIYNMKFEDRMEISEPSVVNELWSGEKDIVHVCFCTGERERGGWFQNKLKTHFWGRKIDDEPSWR